MEDSRVAGKAEFFPVVCALQQLPLFYVSRGEVKLVKSRHNQVAHAISFVNSNRPK